ncbi:hypothetical protein [Acidisoma silvae]|uniref:Uncharacterized protein n=1 Tax=Acidisoma silvae TaxID=2802396 RepID=A0A964E0R9_9PROT|nr:hypothetical protein [Acidisoma silvae]MCB8877815.1 hypothetical protein [Acidisoma silvae]
MSNRDLGIIPQSAFNPFLYASIATEPNGSSLTMLSIFARSGIDPWSEAARWGRQQREITITRLIKIIEDSSPASFSNEGNQKKAAEVAALLPLPEWLPDVTLVTAPIKATVIANGLKKRLDQAGLPRWTPVVVLVLIIAIASVTLASLLHGVWLSIFK